MNPRRPHIYMMDLWATVPYYTAYLRKALLAEGVNLTVGSITYYLDQECYTSRGIKVDPGLMDVVGKYPLPRLYRRALKLMEAMLNLSALVARFLVSPPDVVHVQYLPMLKWRVPLEIWFLKLCRKRGSKIVLTVHDLLPHDTGEAHKRTFVALYSIVDGIICHSDHIRDRLTGDFSVPGEKISVIPHGPFFYDIPVADRDQILSALDVDPGKGLVLWQGIILPYKGVDLLLDAWQHVETKGGEEQLVIAGTGAPVLLEQIRMQVKRLNLKHVKLHFYFMSAQDLVNLYRAADIVVYPYHAITTSGALATGMALGKTIIATDLPVFRELLTSRESALLVDSHDATQLAGAIVELARDSALRERLAAKVREKNFGDSSWRTIARNTEAVYLTVSSPVH